LERIITDKDDIFMVSYEIRDMNIIISYSNGSIDIIPYSDLDEKIVLKKLRSELVKYNKSLNDIEGKYNFLFG
jgi:hypothetical protein